MLLKTSYGLKCYLNYSLHERMFNKKQTVKVSQLYSSPLIFISNGTLRLYAVK